ncbi:MAG: DNA replication complex GINS family protein [Candidatus Bathyarchaeota archaeon]|jgi:hypothetical protein|nr:DNA replication complex GINS family protein [Candidatus Bathyarchaeota archaeon]
MNQRDSAKAISDADSVYENLIVTLIASRSIPDLLVDDVIDGQIDPGQKFETRHWIATHLVDAGLADFEGARELDFSTLYKIHWKETKLQTGRRISDIPEHFYPKLRRYIHSLKQHIAAEATRSSEYHNAQRLARDILNCRLRKIVSLSASTSLTGEMLQKLSVEERALFNNLQTIISEWKSHIFTGSGGT